MPTDTVEEIDVAPDFTGGDIVETPPAEPVVETPPTVDVEAIRSEARREALEEYRRTQFTPQYQQYQQPQQQAPTQPPNVFEIAEQRIFNGDAAGALRDIAATIRQEVTQEVEARYKTQVMPLATDRIVNEIAEGFGPEAKAEVRKLLEGGDPSQLNEAAKSVLRRVARDVDREHKEAAETKRSRLTPEPTASEPARIRINTSDFDQVNAERKRIGLPAVSAAEYKRLYDQENK